MNFLHGVRAFFADFLADYRSARKRLDDGFIEFPASGGTLGRAEAAFVGDFGEHDEWRPLEDAAAPGLILFDANDPGDPMGPDMVAIGPLADQVIVKARMAMHREGRSPPVITFEKIPDALPPGSYFEHAGWVYEIGGDGVAKPFALVSDYDWEEPQNIARPTPVTKVLCCCLCHTGCNGECGA